MPSFIAVDEGTTNAKAIVVAPDGTVHGSASVGLGLSNPAHGHFEQDPDEIWQAVTAVIAGAVAAAGDIETAGLALSTQRESVVAWSRSTGEALSPVIGWQDARTSETCAALIPDHGELVAARTGLHIDAMYSASKLAWLWQSVTTAGHPPDDVCLGTIDAFLVFRLTRGAVFATDASNAARTLLFDIHTLRWDAELCDVFGVPVEALPRVERSDGSFGVAVTGTPQPVPVLAVLGDSHAALYEQVGEEAGVAKVTFGTGSSIMMPIARPAASTSTVDTTLAWLTDSPAYAREGNVLATGSALQTMGRLLGVGEDGRRVAELAATVADSHGVTVVPAFSGLAAPHWDRSAVGLVTGIVRDTTPAQVARATIESVAHQISDVIEEIEASGDEVLLVRADGGASVNPTVMQIQADITGKPVHAVSIAEASAMGAARLAMRAAGTAVKTAPSTFDVYTPSLTDHRRRRARGQWETAVARSTGRSVTARNELEYS